MEDEIKLAEKKRRNTGWYKPGEGFNICEPIVDPTIILCKAGCGGKDHKSSASRKCPLNLSNKAEAEMAQATQDSQEIEDELLTENPYPDNN